MSSFEPVLSRMLVATVVCAALCVGCYRQPQGAPSTPSPTDSVHVGYGKQAPRDVTGAVSEVSTKDGHHGTATTLADLLEGIPGLEVRRLADGSVSLRVRGDRSLNSSGDPLIVLDGIPVASATGMLQDLD